MHFIWLLFPSLNTWSFCNSVSILSVIPPFTCYGKIGGIAHHYPYHLLAWQQTVQENSENLPFFFRLFLFSLFRVINHRLCLLFYWQVKKKGTSPQHTFPLFHFSFCCSTGWCACLRGITFILVIYFVLFYHHKFCFSPYFLGVPARRYCDKPRHRVDICSNTTASTLQIVKDIGSVFILIPKKLCFKEI